MPWIRMRVREKKITNTIEPRKSGDVWWEHIIHHYRLTGIRNVVVYINVRYTCSLSRDGQQRSLSHGIRRLPAGRLFLIIAVVELLRFVLAKRKCSHQYYSQGELPGWLISNMTCKTKSNFILKRTMTNRYKLWMEIMVSMLLSYRFHCNNSTISIEWKDFLNQSPTCFLSPD